MFASYAIHPISIAPDGTCKRLDALVPYPYQPTEGHRLCWRLYGIFATGLECVVADCAFRADAILLYESITGWRVPNRGRSGEPLTDLYASCSVESLQLAREVAQCEHIRDIAEWTDAYPRLVAMARRIIREIDSRAA